MKYALRLTHGHNVFHTRAPLECRRGKHYTGHAATLRGLRPRFLTGLDTASCCSLKYAKETGVGPCVNCTGLNETTGGEIGWNTVSTGLIIASAFALAWRYDASGSPGAAYVAVSSSTRA